MEKKNISNSNIGNQAENIDAFLTDLCNAVINSGLTDGQKELLLLEVQRILNAELKTADNVIDNMLGLDKTADADVKKYRDRIGKLQAVNSAYLEQVFNRLYSDGEISASQQNGSKEHYINRLPLAEVQTDRSQMQKDLRRSLRGFDGSVRGASELKPYN